MKQKSLHNKKSHFSKVQIKEFSILYIMLNYPSIACKKLEEISDLTFFRENENLKQIIIASMVDEDDKATLEAKINVNYKDLINEILENSSIKIILKSKDDNSILELFQELLIELKELNNLKK